MINIDAHIVKSNADKTQWTIHCPKHGNLEPIGPGCIYCLSKKINIDKEKFQQVISNNNGIIIENIEDPDVYFFPTKKQAEKVCEFINQYVLMHKLFR